MLAYHGDPGIKEEILIRLQWHRVHDEFVQGMYWCEHEHKGCAVGCTIHSDNHMDYERLFGIPVALAHVEDHIFEIMSVEDSKGWPIAFMEVIQPGQDLSKVAWKLLLWMYEQDSVQHIKRGIRAQEKMYEQVHDLLTTYIETREVNRCTVESLLGSIGASSNMPAHAVLDILYHTTYALDLHAVKKKREQAGYYVKNVVAAFRRLERLAYDRYHGEKIPKIIMGKLLELIREAPMGEL